MSAAAVECAAALEEYGIQQQLQTVAAAVWVTPTDISSSCRGRASASGSENAGCLLQLPLGRIH
jgi:hypothetical protein